VQRSAAILLLVWFSLSLIPPTLFADADSTLPACCRKSGKHHCSMAESAPQQQPRGVVMRSVRAKCSLYPAAGAIPVAGKASTPRLATRFFVDVVSHPTAHAQSEAQYRVSFSRTRQKRGPPSLS
jgi:hypothetical protein